MFTSPKKIAILALGLIAALAALHSIFWLYATHQAKKHLTALLAPHAEQTSVTYDISSGGWPNEIRLTFNDYRLYAANPETNQSVELTGLKGLTLSAKLTDPKVFYSTLNNVTATLKTQSPSKQEEVVFNVNSGNIRYSNNEPTFIHIAANDISIHETGHKKPIMRADKLEFNQRTETPKIGLADIMLSAQADNLYIHNTNPEKAGTPAEKVHVKKYIVQGGAEDYPQDPVLVTAMRGLMNSSAEFVNIAEFKKLLIRHVQALSANNTRVYLNNLVIETNDYGLKLSGELKTDDKFRPTGNVKLVLDNAFEMFRQLDEEKIKQNPFFAGLKGQSGPVVISLEGKDGLLLLNGLPVFPLPPLPQVITAMPDQLRMQGQTNAQSVFKKAP